MKRDLGVDVRPDSTEQVSKRAEFLISQALNCDRGSGAEHYNGDTLNDTGVHTQHQGEARDKCTCSVKKQRHTARCEAALDQPVMNVATVGREDRPPRNEAPREGKRRNE